MFCLCSMWAVTVRKGGIMSTVSLHNRIRVQRLRGGRTDMPPPPGSRRHVPGELCHLLPLCCSNPRRGSVSLPYWWEAASLPVRLCECMPGGVSAMKSGGASNHSQQLAKIAAFRMGVSAFPKVRHSGASRNLSQVCGQTPAFAGVTIMGRKEHPSQASSHCANTQYHTTRSYGLEARAGAFPPFFLPHAMPP